MMANLDFDTTTLEKKEGAKDITLTNEDNGTSIKFHFKNSIQDGKTSIPHQSTQKDIITKPPGLPKIDLPPIHKDLQLPQIKEKTMPVLKRMDLPRLESNTTPHAQDFLESQNKEKIMPELKRMDLHDSLKNTTTIPTIQSITRENHLEDFKLTLENINEKIPNKYKGDTIKLLSKFFNNRLAKDLKIDFIKEFLEDKDDQDKKHWIIEKFQSFKENTDLRLHLKQKWFSRQIITEKTSEQKEEIKLIADLARKLLDIFINCSLVPTTYLAILGIISNQNEYLSCPESATSLYNNFYLDLFLNQGTIIVMKDQPDISNMMTKTHIGSNISPIKMPNENQTCQNYSLQNTILQIPLMEDISNNRKEQAEVSLPSINSKEETENILPSTSFKKKESLNENVMYLSNIKRGTSKRDLSRLLDEYGNIKKVVKERLEDTNAVIFFHDDKDLQNAINQVDGQEYKGRKLKAQITKKLPNSFSIEDKSDKLSLKSSKPLLTSHIQKFRIVPGPRSTPIHWKKKAINPEEKRRPIKMTLKRMDEDL